MVTDILKLYEVLFCTYKGLFCLLKAVIMFILLCKCIKHTQHQEIRKNNSKLNFPKNCRASWFSCGHNRCWAQVRVKCPTLGRKELLLLYLFTLPNHHAKRQKITDCGFQEQEFFDTIWNVNVPFWCQKEFFKNIQYC